MASTLGANDVLFAAHQQLELAVALRTNVFVNGHKVGSKLLDIDRKFSALIMRTNRLQGNALRFSPALFSSCFPVASVAFPRASPVA